MLDWDDKRAPEKLRSKALKDLTGNSYTTPKSIKAKDILGELIQFIPHTVNGVTIEQRNTDGFTAMCKAHGKDMYSWLRQDSVFDLVSCLALRLSIEPRTVKKRDAGSTKVSSI